MKLPFRNSAPGRDLRQPAPVAVSKLGSCSISAMYREARVGGDFYDFVLANRSRLVFVLLDIAGRRAEALNIAAVVQERFRSQAAELFAQSDVNLNTAVTELLIEVNRSIMQAANGVRCAPAFLGCYDESLGTLVYINAGHLPAFLKDQDGITLLESVGLPLGLFSHATHDPGVTLLRPGAALVLVSKGLVESRAGSREYGTERLRTFLGDRQYQTAQEICADLLQSVQQFMQEGRGLFRRPEVVDDITALALVRAAVAATAAGLP